MDQVRIRHRSKENHDAPQVCGFSLICVLCTLLLLISQSSEYRTLENYWWICWSKNHCKNI